MPMFLCPNCNIAMSQVKRTGVELDVCPQCRGVWLDRGELEKILDNERGDHGPQIRPSAARENHRYATTDDQKPGRDSDHEERYDEESGSRRRRKGGFDIFDIFG